MKTIKYKIVIDSREKENKHIIEAFNKNGISTITRGVPTGDYIIESSGNYVPNIAIERKGSLDELIGNLLDSATKNEHGKNRFMRELDRSKQCNKRLVILIEDREWYSKLLKGQYISRVNSKAISGMIISILAKYPNVSIMAEDKKFAGSMIHKILYYALREDLKEK